MNLRVVAFGRLCGLSPPSTHDMFPVDELAALVISRTFGTISDAVATCCQLSSARRKISMIAQYPIIAHLAVLDHT